MHVGIEAAVPNNLYPFWTP